MGWGVVLLALPAFLAVISSIFTQNKGAPGSRPQIRHRVLYGLPKDEHVIKKPIQLQTISY